MHSALRVRSILGLTSPALVRGRQLGCGSARSAQRGVLRRRGSAPFQGETRARRRFLAAAVSGLLATSAVVPPPALAQLGSPPLISAGKLVAATNATIPPYQFVDAAGKLQGMRIELGEEIARRLGVKMEWVNVGFETHIPGLQSARWDASITGMFLTPERAKILYMIPYELQAVSISVAKGNALKIASPPDLAGRRVAVEIGGYEFRQINRINDE
jgi:polar amino acid transport system substrate-binding protein